MRIFLNASSDLKEKRPAAFLDRDGTINRNRHGEYITRPDQFELYSCALPALRLISQKGYRIIVLSNHSGIGRGYMTQETAKEINLMLARQMEKAGIELSGIYICPHLPDAGCQCRKPKTGLMSEALQDINTDMEHSFIAGDSSGDMRLAAAAGLPGYLVLTGAGRLTAAKMPEAKKYGTLLSLAKALPQIKNYQLAVSN